MHKFDKIKTSADKRRALEKRGKEVSVDFKPGQILLLSEKLDGFNTSVDSDNLKYSRSNELSDMTHHKKLIPFVEMADKVHKHMEPYFNDGKKYQVFGEFMVTDRIIPYENEVYDKWYIFDIYNLTDGCYLGPQEALRFTNHLLSVEPDLSNDLLPLNIIESEYTFTSYADLERYVYELKEDSLYGVNGKMEGMVAYGLDTGLRTKIVNQEFKETQRAVTTGNGHTRAVRWVNQYLTETRLKKLVKNAVVEGFIDPDSDNYFTDQLNVMSAIVWDDILSEADDKPEFKGNDEKNVFNKIEAKTRFVMLDERKYNLEDALKVMESKSNHMVK